MQVLTWYSCRSTIQEASLILTQANSMGYAPTFFGCDGLDGLLAVKNFDTKLADGVML